MRKAPPSSRCTCARRRSPTAAFTLPEMMVTLAIFSIVVLGVVATNLFGLRMLELTEPKMLAGVEAQRLLNRFVEDVREANAADVLQGSTIANEGNILRLEYWEVQQDLTIKTNLTTYEYDSGLAELIRYDTKDGVDGPAEVIARDVDNPMELQVFRREDAAASRSLRQVLPLPEDPEDPDSLIKLADDQQSRSIIALHLVFSRLYPTEYLVGPEHHYKNYQLRSKVAFRTK
jgi:prepilin-type N-terminal cleavage/methylation domain-containing protein